MKYLSLFSGIGGFELGIQYAHPKAKCVGYSEIEQTIDTGMHQHTIDRGRIRRLTPTECERLQGFPDGWTELGYQFVTTEKGNPAWKETFISDTQRYKTLGNAVTVNVIRDVCAKLF